jgi:hypothetical protein
VICAWVVGSAAVAAALLVAVLVISALLVSYVQVIQRRPPFAVDDPGDLATVLLHNLLVLALQTQSKSGVSRWVHEHGGRIAIAFVACATIFSLSAPAYLLGHTLAGVAHFLQVLSAPALLLLAVLAHAIPELIALFLPLAAWIIASRRGSDQLLAAPCVVSKASKWGRQRRLGQRSTCGMRASWLANAEPAARRCRA